MNAWFARILRPSSVAVGLTLVAACGTSPGSPNPDPPIGATITAVSSSQVQADLDSFYSANPPIVDYQVNDVAYSVATRNKVLSVCEHGGASTDEDALQSSRVAACAPMIYFFYSYGKAHSSPVAMALAEDIYNYAVTNIQGPFDTQTTLDSLLKGWGLPVAAGRIPRQPRGLADSLIASARTAMEHASGVHVAVTTRSAAGLILAAVSDSGQSSSSEQLESGAAQGSLIVTPHAAYFSGNATGLSTFFGMSPSEVRRAGGSWISASAGTSQYSSLAPPSLIGSLPSTILPSSTAVWVIDVSVDGQSAYKLEWTAFDFGTGSDSTDTLTVSRQPGNLPIAATTSADGHVQYTSFSHWGERVDPVAPQHSLSFADVATG